MKKEFLPSKRNTDIIDQTLADETLVYDQKTNIAYGLNETCAAVWSECDGTKNVAEISVILSGRLNSSVIEDIVYLALDELYRKKLMIEDRQFENIFSGLSRREVIRRAGLATMVAFPAISFLTAPKAANAASGTTCTLFETRRSFPCDPNGSLCCQPPLTCQPYVSGTYACF